MADNNPNKRKCIEGNDGWKTTRGQTNGDTLVTIARDWFTRQYLVEQHLNGFLREENRTLQARISELQALNARLQRSAIRTRTALRILSQENQTRNETIEFQRRMLVEIFDNYPDVRARYQADVETEEEVFGSETEDEF